MKSFTLKKALPQKKADATIATLTLITITCLCQAIAFASSPPKPYGPVPSERQLLWHDVEFYGFIHFGLNTFTDKEWGDGEVSPKRFNPGEFDADKIVETFQSAGMKGLVLVCKHHDGFCLWPSRYTDYSVKASPWRGGKGDLVKEISMACNKRGLKFGAYLSPWDRHHRDYGRQEYLTYYRNQMSELLTNDGDIFMFWCDGAQGGSGYYGGARETRKVDNRNYYEWPQTWALVRKLQAGTAIFSDAGPDVRWVGNERGIASDPCWYTLNLKDCFPGMPNPSRLGIGNRSGLDWAAPECDMSIRTGWFYHSKDDPWVKSPERLVDIYFTSVGQGACLNLNVPPDTRGLLADKDIAALRGMGSKLQVIFSTDLAQGAKVTATNVRDNDSRFGPQNLLDGNGATYWTTDDGVKTPEAVLDLGKPTEFSVVRLREHLPLGQRVEGFGVDIWQNGRWVEFGKGQSIGHQRLIRAQPQVSNKVRLRITQAGACPAISELSLFLEPQSLSAKTGHKR